MNLKDIMIDKLIYIEEKVFTKKDVFTFLTEKIARLKGVNEDLLLNAVNKRENKLTTAIGLNVAIPHARIKNWGKTTMACLKTKEVKNYESMDSKPVKLVFLFISDSNKPGEHVNVMSKLSYILAEDDNIDKLLNTKSSEELFNSIIEISNAM